VYVVEYRGARTAPFRIADDVYRQGAWQPTLEYFLPAQMCHMRVEEKYRVWHGLDHMDDGRMAPVDTNHFDGYLQGRARSPASGPATACPGWTSAAGTTRATTTSASSRRPTRCTCSRRCTSCSACGTTTPPSTSAALVRIHQPDGRPDVLQQVEHGLLTSSAATAPSGGCTAA
jgi:hypothetical protein